MNIYLTLKNARFVSFDAYQTRFKARSGMSASDECPGSLSREMDGPDTLMLATGGGRFGQKCVRLAQKDTNLGLFQIRFPFGLKSELKTFLICPFGDKLPHCAPRSGGPGWYRALVIFPSLQLTFDKAR